MYFIHKYDWQDSTLTNKSSVGFFRSLKKAIYFSFINLNHDTPHNTIIIFHARVGEKHLARPRMVLEWSDYYESYCQVSRRDPRYKLEVTY